MTGADMTCTEQAGGETAVRALFGSRRSQEPVLSVRIKVRVFLLRVVVRQPGRRHRGAVLAGVVPRDHGRGRAAAEQGLAREVLRGLRGARHLGRGQR